MDTLKKCSLTLLKIALIFIVAIGLAVLSMFLVYLIPTESMFDNAKISSQILSTEGQYKKMFEWLPNIFGNMSFQLDNFTDSIMISEAVFESGNTAINDAMINLHNGWGIDGLSAYFEGNIETYSYSRYWNGYLIFLKPLLLLFSIKGIRILNVVLQILLVIGVCFAFWKKEKRLIIPYILSLVFINPIVISQSMQFSTIFYLMNICLLVTLVFYKKFKEKNWLGYLFVVFGILTSFFDFLTYPLATLTMPLVVVMWFDESGTFKEKFMQILKLSLFWAIGYFGFWISKWVVGSVITGDNLILEALNQAKYRTVGEVSYAPSQFMVYFAFIANLIPLINIKSIIVIVACAVVGIIVKFKCKAEFKINKHQVLSFVLIIALQVVWYLVLSNHSYMHFWFTFRAYAGSIFATFAIFAYGYKDFNIKKKEKEISNEKENSSASTLL